MDRELSWTDECLKVGKAWSGMTQEAFEGIYREWVSYVYALAYRLAGNKVDAEDLTQEAFLRVYRFLGNYRGGSFKGWLYKIVANLFYSKMEKDRNGPVLVDGMNFPAAESVQEAPQANADLPIEQFLRELPPEYRTAVVLADIEELSYQEIAEILGVPIGTVRSRIARGRALMRDKILKGGTKHGL